MRQYAFAHGENRSKELFRFARVDHARTQLHAFAGTEHPSKLIKTCTRLLTTPSKPVHAYRNVLCTCRESIKTLLRASESFCTCVTWVTSRSDACNTRLKHIGTRSACPQMFDRGPETRHYECAVNLTACNYVTFSMFEGVFVGFRTRFNASECVCLALTTFEPFL